MRLSHCHLLCSHKDIFCGQSHYLSPDLLLSVRQKHVGAKLILLSPFSSPMKLAIDKIHFTVASVLSDSRGQ